MMQACAPPRFDQPVTPGGYQWWYLDALNPQTGQGIVVIAFVGSVFSPYYFHARQRRRPDPEDFCAVNVGLYRRRGKTWCMTERRAASIRRERDQFRLGQSSLSWVDGELVVEIRERSAPFGQRLLGRVRARPTLPCGPQVTLDQAGGHLWHPWSPMADVQVEFSSPAEQWRGTGYMDYNRGDEPLEDAFRGWHWSRCTHDGEVEVQYDLSCRDGRNEALALRFGPEGCQHIEAGQATELAMTGWRVARTARVTRGADAAVIRTLEDTPFYARSLLSVEHDGAMIHGVHEALSLERFRRGWVRLLLPFRMPREWRASGP